MRAILQRSPLPTDQITHDSTGKQRRLVRLSVDHRCSQRRIDRTLLGFQHRNIFFKCRLGFSIYARGQRGVISRKITHKTPKIVGRSGAFRA